MHRCPEFLRQDSTRENIVRPGFGKIGADRLSQNIGRCDQCSYSIHLFDQSHLGMHVLGDLLDPPIVFRDSLLQRFVLFQSGSRASRKSRPRQLSRFIVLSCTSSTARRTTSPTLARFSSGVRGVHQCRAARITVKWICAFAQRCAPGLTSRDRFWRVVPASSHQVDRFFDYSRRSVAR
jgi:hypothetical protein